MSTYENAPATAMLATSCACCGRPLLDAVSAEAGVGPDCRVKHGFGEAQGEARWADVVAALRPVDEEASETVTEVWDNDAHRAANALIQRIAHAQTGPHVMAYTRALDALGYQKIARRIAKRLGAIVVEADGETLLVHAPYSETFNWHARRVPGQSFDRARRVRVVPTRSRRELWQALCAAFPDTLVAGERLAVTAS